MSRQIHVAKLFAAALAAALALTLASSNATNAQIGGLSVDPVLQENISALGAGDATQAILTYDENPTAEEVAAVEETGVAVHTFDELPMLAVQGNAAQLNDLISLDSLTGDGVRGIFANERLEYFLDESVPLIGADTVNEELGFTGEGVGVAVIDSGVDGTHGDVRFPERTVQNVKILGDNIFTGQTIALENQPNTDTSSGHGTHVASTVGGDGTESGVRYAGVAPDSDIIGIGAGDALFILYALESFDYALENQDEYNIQVISNSYGTSGEFDPEDPMNVATKAAHDAGMTVVFASGNSGPEEDTLNPYSVAPWVIGGRRRGEGRTNARRFFLARDTGRRTLPSDIDRAGRGHSRGSLRDMHRVRDRGRHRPRRNTARVRGPIRDALRDEHGDSARFGRRGAHGRGEPGPHPGRDERHPRGNREPDAVRGIRGRGRIPRRSRGGRKSHRRRRTRSGNPGHNRSGQQRRKRQRAARQPLSSESKE
jgi:hypothetical protein